ncbi:hypothetical protein CVU83_03400 [Candidatus Falkowbacteria bacterium HGW-Falkowbacteria-2]|uniref:Type 4 fimbrial biogenesis protein PilX N-terminal domain-containing protein n=1 Tax=Candidatus Falkowbacteria bacterium HGW-Falkowbacteria-2 TaxID=2013769 RepID=A0A2N2DX85_9BACT|nr:MAG: hypothetical protein CVU83_03400 [Candidatus Falkowbacteria bacterium HGW-Falkowbacteria-2]
MKYFKKYNQKGSAVLLTLFILSGIMLIVFGGASVVIAGLKMGGIQSQSTRAYFAAEAGAERLLYDFRKTTMYETTDLEGTENVYGTTTLSIGSSYIINYDHFAPIIFTSIGSYQNTKRSVELNF